jgi:hypothetical protein
MRANLAYGGSPLHHEGGVGQAVVDFKDALNGEDIACGLAGNFKRAVAVFVFMASKPPKWPSSPSTMTPNLFAMRGNGELQFTFYYN